MKLLALDISSTHVGIALFDDDTVLSATSYAFTGTLQARLVKIGDLMTGLLKLKPDTLAIEAPAYSRFEHVALQRAVGAVVSRWHGEVVEIAPNAAKIALTGNGRAEKTEMIRAARWFAPGMDPDEHAADAVAVGLAALAKLKVEAL